MQVIIPNFSVLCVSNLQSGKVEPGPTGVEVAA